MSYSSQVKILFCFILIALPLSYGHANLLPAEKPPIFNNFCENAKTPADQQSCTQKRYENSEAALKTQYESFIRFLNNTQHADDMKNTQNAWIEYRNKECKFEAGFFEEEIAKRTLELSCLSRLTEQRALLLYNFVPRVRKQTQQQSMNE